MKILSKLSVILILITLANCSSMGKTNSKKSQHENTLPIIYSSKYNMTIMGIENFHPFDTKKFKKVAKYLSKNCNISKSQFIKPYEITNEELQLVHTSEYIESLKKSRAIAQVVELPFLRFLPSFVLKAGLLKPMKLGTGGTVLGVKEALRQGWAINLSGGYHHAKSGHGEGFCFFADIPIAIETEWKENPELKVLIVDLDAHQGNGVSAILGKDKRIAILDIYNHNNYPDDIEAEKLVSHNVPIPRGTNDNEYLKLVEQWSEKAITDHNPDLIIYNAGSDIFFLDPLGGLSITKEGIIKRDSIIFEKAKNNEIPILMVLSGGYHKRSGEIIAKSIENILYNIVDIQE